MRSFLIFLITLLVILPAQSVKILKDEPVTSLSEGQFYYPKTGSSDNQIFLTSVNYSGLWTKNITDGSLNLLTSAPGSGYEPVISRDSKLFFKEDQYVNGRRMSSLWQIDISNFEKQIVEENIRNLKILNTNDQVAYTKAGEINVISYTAEKLQKADAEKIFVYSENSVIKIAGKDKIREITPFGNKNYIWTSVSPDGKKILFTVPGKGTYICNPEGQIISDLGYINYPTWSPDGRWILGMQDYDNGVAVTSSDLIVCKADGSNKTVLSADSKRISMYPVWGKTNNTVFYNSNDGIIYRMSLSYE